MYIDTHSHLNLEQFNSDYHQVLERMRELSVRTHTVGVDIQSSRRAIELSDTYPAVSRAVVGIHPAYVDQNTQYADDIEDLKQLAQHELCVGIGECGFDYFRCKKSEMYNAQMEVFVSQVRLAQELSKPLMLHLRPTRHLYDAYDDALVVLEEFRGEVVGQAHFFAGTIEHAKRFLDLGYYISCTGVITFTSDYDELVRYVPVDRLLLETDAPYVAPAPYRGGRCEPSHVKEVYERVAELVGRDVSDLVSVIEGNVRELYGW